MTSFLLIYFFRSAKSISPMIIENISYNKEQDALIRCTGTGTGVSRIGCSEAAVYRNQQGRKSSFPM